MRFMRKKKAFREYLKHQSKIREKLEDAEIIAKTPLLPCEDYDKVRIALKNVVDGELVVESLGDEKYLVIYTSGAEKIERIFNQFRNRKVLATLRKYLLNYSSESEIVFYLHKQAAYRGIYSLSEPGESPGGEITIIIKVEDPKEVILWLTRF